MTADYELVKQALLRRHDLDPDGVFDAETDAALRALERLRERAVSRELTALPSGEKQPQ